MFMVTVTLEALQRSLEEYVRQAEAGEAVAITVENRVVAELRPVASVGGRAGLEVADTPGLEEAMAPYYPQSREGEYLGMEDQTESWEDRGVREGWLTRATIKEKSPPTRHPLVPFDELMRELEQDREDR